MSLLDPFLVAVNKGKYQEKESCFESWFGSPMVVQARQWVTAGQQEDGTVRSHLGGSGNREKNAGTQIAFFLFHFLLILRNKPMGGCDPNLVQTVPTQFFLEKLLQTPRPPLIMR